MFHAGTNGTFVSLQDCKHSFVQQTRGQTVLYSTTLCCTKNSILQNTCTFVAAAIFRTGTFPGDHGTSIKALMSTTNVIQGQSCKWGATLQHCKNTRDSLVLNDSWLVQNSPFRDFVTPPLLMLLVLTHSRFLLPIMLGQFYVYGVKPQISDAQLFAYSRKLSSFFSLVHPLNPNTYC